MYFFSSEQPLLAIKPLRIELGTWAKKVVHRLTYRKSNRHSYSPVTSGLFWPSLVLHEEISRATAADYHRVSVCVYFIAHEFSRHECQELVLMARARIICFHHTAQTRLCNTNPVLHLGSNCTKKFNTATRIPSGQCWEPVQQVPRILFVGFEWFLVWLVLLGAGGQWWD